MNLDLKQETAMVKLFFFIFCLFFLHKQPSHKLTMQFDIMCQCNYESYKQDNLLRTNFEDGQNFVFLLGSFFTKRDTSRGDCLDSPDHCTSGLKTSSKGQSGIVDILKLHLNK